MQKNYLYVANWKMNLSHRETVAFATDQYDELISLASQEAQLVICPSFEALFPLARMFAQTPIAIGAQDCSNKTRGSYTGQVSAQSIAEVGCSYCIIGHSERRILSHETNEEVAEKLVHLLDFGLTPIICIGELLEEYEAKKTEAVLSLQLTPIIEALSTLPAANNREVIIAYEPVWSIGTGIVAAPEHLEVMFSWLATHLHEKNLPCRFLLLYGGSVSGNNAQELKKIEHIDGFLIGKASVDFQTFKNIVQYA